MAFTFSAFYVTSIVLFHLLEVSLTDQCPPGWLFFDNKCYTAYEELQVTFKEAESICMLQNANLPSITNLDINSFLNNWLTNSTTITQAWTSAHKANFTYFEKFQNGIIWFWKNEKTFQYTNWHSGQPQNLYSMNCVVFRNTYDTGRGLPDRYDWFKFYDWATISCMDKAAVICEKSACPLDWEEFKGRCYKSFDALKLTHYDATNYCRKYQANLISITSMSENRFVSSLLNRTCSSSSFIWTSGKYAQSSRNYLWVWEELNRKFGYTNWLQGHESGVNGYCMNLQNRISMENDTLLGEYKWAKHPCQEKNSFICRKTA